MFWAKTSRDVCIWNNHFNIFVKSIVWLLVWDWLDNSFSQCSKVKANIVHLEIAFNFFDPF